MDQTNYINDVQQRMATYSFDSQIKVSYIFDNCDSDEEQSRPLLPEEFPEQFVTQAHSNANALPSFNETYPNFENMNNIRSDISKTTKHSALKNLLKNRSRNNDEINKNNKCQKSNSITTMTSSTITKPKVSKTGIHKNMNKSQDQSPNDVPNYQCLLDEVSVNLIVIIKWYRYYNCKYMNKCIDLNTALYNFGKRKTYLFQISQSTTELYIWPNENNDKFIKCFITRTIDLANSKNRVHIAVEELKLLIWEMIHFTKKQNQQSIDSYLPMVSSKSNNITKLNSNDVLPAKNQNSVCLFSKGEPGREVSINIDAVTLKNNSQLFRHNKSTKSNCNINHSSKRQNTKHNDGSCQIFNQTRNLQSHDSHNQQTHTAQNILPGHSLQTVTTSNSILNKSKSVHNNFENSYRLSPEMRSFSRDSGFFSPVSNISDQSCNPHYVKDQNCIPKNPAALFTYCGLCKICGVATRHMCLNCCKEYYCSNVCQKIDWDQHKKTCLRKNDDV